jgi:hypothetical protein
MMTVVSSLVLEEVSADERWRRWQQRGRDQDARFKRRAGRLLAAAVVIAIPIVLFMLTR